MKDIRVIFVPFRSGTNRDGTQWGPKALEESLLMFQKMSRTYLHYDNEYKTLTDEMKYGVRNYANVYQMAVDVRDYVYKFMQNGESVFILGGDHSIALGSIAGVLQNNNNVGIIWFDAHGDINTEETSPSGNAHGMPIAALLGLCKSGLNNIAKNRLNPHNIFWIGVRDLDDGEKEILHNLGIENHVYSTELIHKKGIITIMNDIRRQLKEQQIEQLHISFDIDGMDPSVVYATGTKVPNGLYERDVMDFMKQLKKFPLIQSVDFVEYNPNLEDTSFSTKKWCTRIIQQLLDKFYDK